MSGYTKLYESIIVSSIWNEDDKTRIMWITFLAMADPEGYVAGSIPGMAAMARMTIQEAEAAIEKLCGPDPYSQSQVLDGARLTPAEDGGWMIINHKKYSQMSNTEKRKAQNRKAAQTARDKRKGEERQQ